jgi:hypothetical protein
MFVFYRKQVFRKLSTGKISKKTLSDIKKLCETSWFKKNQPQSQIEKLTTKLHEVTQSRT